MFTDVFPPGKTHWAASIPCKLVHTACDNINNFLTFVNVVMLYMVRLDSNSVLGVISKREGDGSLTSMWSLCMIIYIPLVRKGPLIKRIRKGLS